MSLLERLQQNSKELCAVIPFDGLENELSEELGRDSFQYENLFFISKKILDDKIAAHKNVIWAKDIWPAISLIHCPSISQGSNELKKISAKWAHFPIKFHRRSELIQQNLIPWKVKPIQFLQSTDTLNTFGAWTLIEKDWILACAKTHSQFPNGEIQFQEDKQIPPSRAYLKLWEMFTLHCEAPQKSDVVLDLGSSPGGWTWVLQTTGCKVISVDKAALDKKIGSLKNITYLKKDAFALQPNEIPQVDWLFSDIICSPEKLYELVLFWKNSGKVKKFLCTLKFKGKTDFSIIKKFKNIPNSKLIHLYNNKHELTWLHL